MAINTGALAGNTAKVAACAIEQGSTWNTPVAVGAGDGIAITGESVAGGREALARQEVGFPEGQQPDVGAEVHRGELRLDLMHGAGHGRLLSYLFGTSGAPTQTPPSTGTTYLHTLTFARSNTKFATLVVAKRDGQKWWEYKSVKARRLTIAGAGNARVTGALEVVASQLDRDSATNTTTQTNAVTVPTRQGLCYAKQGLFRLNAQAGGALASPTDDVAILGFNLVVERDLDEAMLVDGTNTIAQPNEQGESNFMLDITFRSYDVETWIAAFLAKTEYKADLKFLSGVTPSGGSEMYWLLNFARMVVAEQPQAPMGDRGPIRHTVRFKLLTPSAAPTGMAGLTMPMEIQVLDESSATYLA